MVKFTPVFEAPWYREGPEWSWAIANKKPFALISISHQANSEVIGSFFAEFAPVLQEPDPRPDKEILSDLLGEKMVSSRLGGLMIEDGDTLIKPGCCGDLFAFREWWLFLKTGARPWTGHDPSPWATAEGENSLKIWSDGGLSGEKTEPSILVTREEFEAGLIAAIHKLEAFGQLCVAWLLAQNIPMGKDIGMSIMEEFKAETIMTL